MSPTLTPEQAGQQLDAGGVLLIGGEA